MNRKCFTNLLALSTTAISSYYIGCYVEQRHQLNRNDANTFDKFSSPTWPNYSDKLVCKPGLPVFGTVSAAVPATTEEVNLTATPQRVREIMKYGFPGLENVRSYSDFVLSYDTRNRIPRWVFEHLTPASVAKNNEVDRSKCTFKPDPSIHTYFSAQNADYFRSGFDRGHMAAAGNHRKHQQHCEDTFYLTNMAPQVGAGFNRDAWNRLEMYVRKLTITFPNVYVCTGPLFLPRQEPDGKNYIRYQVLGANTVAVPTHFYKIIVGENSNQELEMEAYVMPNQAISDDTPLEVFRVPPESIERASGLLFFSMANRKLLTKINGKKV